MRCEKKFCATKKSSDVRSAMLADAYVSVIAYIDVNVYVSHLRLVLTFMLWTFF